MTAIPKGALNTMVGMPGAEMSQADVDYASAMKEIKESLERRSGLDPTMLALAQGFFAPTKSGGFGESISNAAANYLPVQQAEDKRIQELAGLRLQIASAEKGEANKRAAQQAFMQMTGNAPASAAGTKGDAQAEGQGGQPPASAMKPVTIADALRYAGQFPDQKDLAARMMEAAKAGLDRYSMSMNGIVFDKEAGKYLNVDIPGQTQSAYSTPYGTFQMLPNEYSRFTIAQKAGMGKEWMNAFKSGNQFEVDKLVAQKLEGKPATPSVAKTTVAAEEPEGGRLTVAEQEAQAAGAKRTAEERAKAENTRYQDFMNKGAKANDMIANAKAVEAIATQPKMRTAIGYFETPDGLSAIGKYMESKEKGEKVLRQIVTQYNAPQDVIDNLSVLQTLINNTTIEARRLAQGQGPITDREGPLYERVGPSTSDPYEAFMKKNKMLMERAVTQKELADALESSGMNADKFMRSKQYETIVNNYISKLETIVGGAKTDSKNPQASQKLRKELGIN